MHAADRSPAEPTTAISPLIDLLRCIDCGGTLRLGSLISSGGYPDLGPNGELACTQCRATFAIVRGTARMLSNDSREGVDSVGERTIKQQTAESFAYEWEQFGGWRDDWRRNFLDYLSPIDSDWFEGRLVLDVGGGSGRHSYWAQAFGARVVTVDLGESIDVARRNLPAQVLTVQADAESLPFEPGTFDLVMSIGVLHHLPDPGRALRSISRYAKPGGLVRIYVYWQPPVAWHRAVLRLVNIVRRATVRMPHRVLHLLCYPLAALLYATVVLPYRGLRRVGRLRRLADQFPLKTYADYPFVVCLNDQFDRLSAPLERRYTADEVEGMLTQAGLVEISVAAHHGWLSSGRRRAQE